MGIRESIAKWLLPELKAANSYPHWALAMAENARHSVPRLELPQKQAELYQRLSWVAIAVGTVASEAASVPLEVFRAVGEDMEEVVNHPFEMLMKKPNPRRSRFELLEATFLYRLLTGNAYWWLNKASEDAEPEEIWVIPSHRIEPIPDGQMYLKGYLYDPGNGQKIPLETWEIAHFRRFNPFNSFVGMSPIESLATVAVGDLAMQKWNTNFFDKDNAKIPGALTFSDPIPDPEWERLKADFKEQHGGSKRGMLMLRNTGAGGVNWVQMAMTQKDMEFLAAREFNKQEIYDMYAPGLNQWLSTDTTSANAKSGRDAFFELAIHPLLQAVSETVSNNIMPLYGENMEAAFEDVRPKDRALQLQEQQAFSQVHTVNEIRQQWYNADPIGDDRGELLPQEIGKAGGGGGFDIAPPGRDIIPAAETQDEQIKADKEKERAQFRRFAGKRVDEGKPEKIEAFVFEYLDDGEQAAIKSEFRQDGTEVLATRLQDVIEELRKVSDVEVQ